MVVFIGGYIFKNMLDKMLGHAHLLIRLFILEVAIICVQYN